MPAVLRGYVRIVEAVTRRIGRVAMYLIFAMMGILLWSSISKTFFMPTLWTLEMAQFTMVAYYLLGGPYALQLGSNVRMDLFYSGWSPRTKAWVDGFTVLAMLFYLGVLLYGGLSSLAYSLGHFKGEPFGFLWDVAATFASEGSAAAEEKLGFLERSPTAWRPMMWPIKLLMCAAVLLMLLQGIAILIRDIATIRGEEI
ncbi:TRAP transporter small permease subunit [Paralimibaculum aggregatum]|uniref:TRAP transporter small permease protein n=1 Tax=Paralimibaculum aggregatum TaxID=3036245 RepID=A0ABQ6LPX7_9RHOB|nr:TRAP transporter small permease subunit [Limibaculum sp. NKW23]GMG84639.1 TRAP transporter small permease subunit [Limibaculum sp. NKW23]